MSRFSEMLGSTLWKKIMNKAYAWGAAIVIIGALMKLEHYAYSSYFLIQDKQGSSHN
ncbi:hypothetical protein ACFLSY_11635, partial [Bacteroidota bacterium]